MKLRNWQNGAKMEKGTGWSIKDGKLSVCLFGASVFAVIWIFSQDIAEALKFFLFFVFFNCLPSLVLLDLLFPRWRNLSWPPLFLISFAPVGGLVFILPWWAINLKLGYSLIPVFALLLYQMSRARADSCYHDLNHPPQLLLVAAVLAATPIISLGLTWSGPLHDHLLIQASIASKLDEGYRPEFSLAAGVPLAYNYAAHIWLSASSFLTGISLEHLVAYSGPALLLYCAAAAFASVAFYAGLSGWVVALVICCVFWDAGFPMIGARLFARAFTWPSVLLIGPLLAYSAFLALVMALADWFSTPEEPRSGRMYAFAFLIMLVLVGCRAPGGLVLLCAVSFLILFEVVIQRRLNFASIGMLAVLSAAVGFALVFFLGYGTRFDAGGFTKISAAPFSYLGNYTYFWLPGVLERNGVNPKLAGALQFAVFTIFQAGFFAPFLAFRVTTLRRPHSSLELLLIGTAMAGIGAVFFLESPGGSHFTFLYYSTLAFSLLGASAFAEVIGRRSRRFYPAVAIAGLLATAQIVELPFRALGGIAARWAPPSSQARQVAQRCVGESLRDIVLPAVPAGASVVLPADIGLCQILRFTIRNPNANNYTARWLSLFSDWETSLKPDLKRKLELLGKGPATLAANLPSPSYVIVIKGDELAADRVDANH